MTESATEEDIKPKKISNAELEKILNSSDPRCISIQPDGSVLECKISKHNREEIHRMTEALAEERRKATSDALKSLGKPARLKFKSGIYLQFTVKEESYDKAVADSQKKEA